MGDILKSFLHEISNTLHTVLYYYFVCCVWIWADLDTFEKNEGSYLP